jgi:hypothetical protein
LLGTDSNFDVERFYEPYGEKNVAIYGYSNSSAD